MWMVLPRETKRAAWQGGGEAVDTTVLFFYWNGHELLSQRGSAHVDRLDSPNISRRASLFQKSNFSQGQNNSGPSERQRSQDVVSQKPVSLLDTALQLALGAF